jgi:RNA polymerase sigma-70 factor (sigma-E family)
MDVSNGADELAADATATRDEAVDLLWRREHARLTKLAAGLTGDPGAGEEIVQDAFAGLLRQWRQLRDPAAAPAYLHRAVVNGARGRWRRRRLAGQAMPAWPPPEDAGPDVEARADMLAALARLPYGRRACLLLRYYVDLTEAQAADVLGISVGTVKSQTARGLHQLETALRESGHEVRRS